MSMIPYGRQTITKEDERAVQGVLRSPWLTQGPKIARFEERLAKECGARFAVVVSSGTAALHLTYLALGIGKGDEVITTPNTFVATTNMLLLVGAKPVFVDIRRDTYNIDERMIEQAVMSRTKAIVPVHFAGHPSDLQTVLNIAKKHRLAVVEDACHALGASYKGKPIGSHSDAVIFSFHPVKSITTGEGGVIVTNRKDICEKAKLLRSHGIVKDANGFNMMQELGYNYRMTDLQASLGISQLKRLPLFIQKRRRSVFWYRELLAPETNVVLPVELQDSESSWHLFVLRVVHPKDRLPLYVYLQKAGIGVNFHYPPVYSHSYYRQHGFKSITLPETERYAKTALTLPLYPDLKKKEIMFICAKIRDYFGHHANR